MNNINWLKTIKHKVISFIDLISEDDYRYFRYSMSGDLYNRNDKWGLGQLVFAAKILYMLNASQDITLQKKENLTGAIQAFEGKEGYISDNLIINLYKNRTPGGILKFLKKKPGTFDIEKVKRAETRQAYAALQLLGAKASQPFLQIPYDKDSIISFLSQFDWSKPWDAGSHFSHLMFFLKANSLMFGYKVQESENLIVFTDEWIDGLQNKNDGFWYKGSADKKQRINGAMKILTGKAAAGIKNIYYHEKIIDGCLESVNDTEACSNFNIIYCLYCCSRVSDYRKREIAGFCEERLNIYRNYYFNDTGAFSFYQGKANDYYYGAKITSGLNEPDIHGTVMFLWGITLISKMIEIDFLDFKVPIT